RYLEEVTLPVEPYSLPAESGFAPEEKTISHSQVDCPVGGVASFQALDATRLDRCNDQAESSNGHSERVEVHAPDPIECLLSSNDFIALSLQPQAKEPGERSQEKVPRAASRIDQPHLLK